MSTLTEEEWEEQFLPMDAPDGGFLWEWEECQARWYRCVWTVVDGDEGDALYVLPGYHVVNRLGYTVTLRPWHDGDVEVRLQGVDPW